MCYVYITFICAYIQKEHRTHPHTRYPFFTVKIYIYIETIKMYTQTCFMHACVILSHANKVYLLYYKSEDNCDYLVALYMRPRRRRRIYKQLKIELIYTLVLRLGSNGWAWMCDLIFGGARCAV